MKYFVSDRERINTVYHEFQKGHWDEKTFWKDDSICLSDDLLYTLGIEDLFSRTIPNYCSYGEVEVTPQIWEAIKREAGNVGGSVHACITEADEWVQSTFLQYGVFTIIGV